MKKPFIWFAGILVGLFLVLSVLDKSDYPLEKRLWRLHPEFRQIVRDPTVVPDQKYEQLVNQYRGLVRDYPHSRLLPQIHFQIGRVYALKRDFVKSRQAFAEILNSFPGNDAACAEALLNIGMTHEQEKDDTQAQATYRKLMEAYPLTEVGMNIPLYLVNYQKRLNHPAESQKALEDAIVYYQKLAKEQAQTRPGFTALQYLSVAYMGKQNWEEAIRTLSGILFEPSFHKFLDAESASSVVKSINTVSVMQLRNYDLPIGIYEDFIQRYPEHPLCQPLQEILQGLKRLREESHAQPVSTP